MSLVDNIWDKVEDGVITIKSTELYVSIKSLIASNQNYIITLSKMGIMQWDDRILVDDNI